jgi:hypothetical protein
MAARTKYSEALVKAICDRIAETGRDIDGYKGSGITYETFYRWIADKPEFSEAVEAARKRYSDTSLPQLRSWAKQGLSNTLRAVAEGREIVTTTTVSGVGPEGPIDSETIQRKPAMVPIQQAFTYVMGKDLDLIQWLHQGVNLGVFPTSFIEGLIDDIDGVKERIRAAVEGRISPKSDPQQSIRIDPGVAIAASLGLSNTTALPETVGTRPKPSKNLAKVTPDRG